MLPPLNLTDDVERFGAESVVITSPIEKCSHEHLKRLTANSVECTQCHNGWLGLPQDFFEQEDIKGRLDILETTS